MDRELKGLRGLVVEDDYFVLVSIEQLLLDAGCESIASAATLDQALDLVASHYFDFATLDLNLNGEATYPVAVALAARGVPFCFSTGYSDPALRGDFVEQPFLIKPYGVSKLASVISVMVGRSDITPKFASP